MTGNKILIVEDDPNLLKALDYNLSKEGYDVVTTVDGAAAVGTARGEKPDLVILDVMLPKITGFEVCRILSREMTVLMLMLTAKIEETDKIVGLEIGADDYMTKPFSMRELLTRATDERTLLKVGDLEIDLARHRTTLMGTTLELTPKEFDLLAFLARNRGLVFNREQLLQKV